MHTRQHRSAFLLCSILLSALLAPRTHAEDIDIYTGTGANAGVPNVLIVIDNSSKNDANGGAATCYLNSNGVPTSTPSVDPTKVFGQEMCALYNLIDALPTGTGGSALFNVGVILFGSGADKTAYVLKALTPMTTAAKAAFKTQIYPNWKLSTLKANESETSKALAEAYRYFKEQKPLGNVPDTSNSPLWDLSSISPTTGKFVLPNDSTGCAKKYVIFIGNGDPGDNPNPDMSGTAGGELTFQAGGTQTKIIDPLANTGQYGQEWGLNWAQFMHLGSTNVAAPDIVTHVIAFASSKCGAIPCRHWYASLAQRGGGIYATATDGASVLAQLLKLFADIQAVSSVFTAASLPVAVNSRGTYLNQVFLGMFVPDADARPRWYGNIKQYKFKLDNLNNLTLVDSVDSPAVSSSTGFITPTAISFWTTSSSFWTNAPDGIPPSISDSPDGAVVAKGAAAQMLRSGNAFSQAARSVFTCFSCASGTTLGASSATQFSTANTANITQALLGAANTTERDAIINWVRGTDNVGDEFGPGSPTTVRPSIHGDVLHSRPAVVNYGGSTGVVVFYGANDGMLHAINGNQTGSGAGAELWSFVPQEMMGNLKRLRDNSPLVAFPNVSAAITPTPTPRGYFVDGPISTYQHITSDGSTDKVYLYVAMRRGGKLLYAFDVTTPGTPKFLWKKSQSDIAGLGQTWSEARVAKIRGNANPVLVMGLGYDATAEDQTPAGSPTVSGGATVGAGVVVLDAFTGNILKTFTGTDRSVPADVSLVDADNDSYVDRGYAVDLGGNIYRIDFETESSVAISDWAMTKLASLGSAGGKKFFYAPDVVVTKSYSIVLVGSGDREKPLSTTSSDYFFTVLDVNLGKGLPAGFTPIVFSDLANQNTGVGGTYGCYLPLNTAGEKVVTAPLTVGGTTYFSTNMPSPPAPGSCTANLGIAKAYALPLLCQAPTPPQIVTLNGGGLPPSPVGGIVQVTKSDGSEVQVPFIIGSGANNSPIEPAKVKPSVTPKRLRRFWYDESTP